MHRCPAPLRRAGRTAAARDLGFAVAFPHADHGSPATRTTTVSTGSSDGRCPPSAAGRGWCSGCENTLRNVEAGSTRAEAVDAGGGYFLYKDNKLTHDSLPLQDSRGEVELELAMREPWPPDLDGLPAASSLCCNHGGVAVSALATNPLWLFALVMGDGNTFLPLKGWHRDAVCD